MAEILEDIRLKTVEIYDELGLNFTTENSRINHSGDVNFDMTSNGNIEIKTGNPGNDITIVTQENDSVIVPYTLKAGEVHQAYDPQSGGVGPYALLVPTGAVMPYAGATAPAGWLLCNGSSLSITSYSTLFSVVDYTYGGTGANFNIPDLRSRFPLGAGDGPGLSTRIRAELGGQEGITNVPPHTHNYDKPTYERENDTTVVVDTNNYSIGTSSQKTTNTGDNIVSPSVDVMNPFLVLNYIIKV